MIVKYRDTLGLGSSSLHLKVHVCVGAINLLDL